jgi:hypothetical protein
MNDLYSHTVHYNGKTYRYDPEQDIFYCERPITTWDAYGWLAVILTLAAIALYFEFYPLR